MFVYLFITSGQVRLGYIGRWVATQAWSPAGFEPPGGVKHIKIKVNSFIQKQGRGYQSLTVNLCGGAISFYQPCNLTCIFLPLRIERRL